MEIDKCNAAYGSRTELGSQECNITGPLGGSEENQIKNVNISSKYPASGCWQYQTPDTTATTGSKDWVLGSGELCYRIDFRHRAHQ